MSDNDIRTCSICEKPFEDPRAMGRPRSLCGPACRRESARRRQRKYMDRLIQAGRQLQAA